MYRHEPMTAKVRSLVDDGAIGSVRAIASGFTFMLEGNANIRLDRSLGGGALWDIGCYPVTYAQLIAGHEPKLALGIAHWTAGGVDANQVVRSGICMTSKYIIQLRTQDAGQPAPAKVHYRTAALRKRRAARPW